MDALQGMWIILLRSLSAVIVLFLISRLEGARQISQLTYYDYIVGISIGSVAAIAVEENIPLIHIIVSMIVFGLFSVVLALVASKSILARRLFSGKPCIMIYNGKIIPQGLKKNHFDINDLLLNCRLQGYFDIEDIAFAILETNGQLSVMQKSEKAPLKACDVALNPQKAELEYNLIIDGKVLPKNLKAYGKNMTWLKNELKANKIKSESEVLLAIGGSNNKLKIYLQSEALPHNHFFM